MEVLPNGGDAALRGELKKCVPWDSYPHFVETSLTASKKGDNLMLKLFEQNSHEYKSVKVRGYDIQVL